MGKFNNIESDVFGVFSTTAWRDEHIATIPVNFSGDVGREYIRVKILSEKDLNIGFARGLLMIDIFTPAGEGPSRATAIADKLDSYLVGKKFNATQFQGSSFETVNLDAANPTLFRSMYSITFHYFGVF
jgi:hypothetical protein